jgi:nicotinate-nucleotide pyrophosphorylase (carboxylating)
VLEIRGDLRRILGIERTALNFLMHLSGVATSTRRAIRAAGEGDSAPRVYATRKTLPGLRDLEKAAVRHGGGEPHRRDLSSAFLIKNNHLAFLPIETAVRRARSVARGAPIEVEVRSAAEARRAVGAGADALLIDNRRPSGARAVVRALERAGLRDRVWVELSGGLTPENVRRYRASGADALSLGSITHSAAALPFHLVVRRPAVTRRRRPS